MATRTKKPKYLSEYEENLIWMSYRYCIGRHTITAHHHAMDIAQHAYGKMSRERQEFMAYDIRREIAEHIRYGETSFTIIPAAQQNANWFRPLELFINGLKHFNIRTQGELSHVKWIHYTADHTYEIKYFDESEQPTYSSYRSMDIDDLIIWEELANLFDYKSHKIATVKHPETGEISKIEVFKSFILKDHYGYEYIPVWKEVSNNISSYSSRYLNDECIVSIEDL